MNISVCTYCKGRRQHAEQSIPLILEQLEENDELVVVDYDCPDKISEYCKSLNNNKLKIVKIDNLDYYSPSHAHNLAFKFSKNEILFFMDIDILLKENCIKNIKNMFNNHENIFLLFRQNKKLEAVGTCSFLRKKFIKINGYPEEFCGYGYEDYHIYESLRNIGLKSITCEYIEKIYYKIDRVKNFFTKYNDNNDLNLCEYIYKNKGGYNLTKANIAIGKIFRKIHPYKNNIFRNWGVGGYIVT